MDLRGMGWEGVDWIYLAQDRNHLRAFVNKAISLRVPWKAERFLTMWMNV